MTELANHPASMLFPMMEADELKELAEDIKANGQMEQVVLYQGQVLDGRSRLAACRLAEVEPHLQELDGEVAHPVLYVLSKNLHCRHLTTSQRGAIAGESLPLLQEEAKKRQGGTGRFPLSHSVSGLAPIGAEVARERAVEIAARSVEAHHEQA
ncbi:MAG: hypothetical protein ACRD20_00705 [Terriglobales bacterium]